MNNAKNEVFASYTFKNLKDFLTSQDFQLITVADAETRVHSKKNEKIIETVRAGGVSIALEPVARASQGIYIGRGKTEEDRQVVDGNGKIVLESSKGSYVLKRIFFSPEELESYYNGFSNQTLWPLCHVAFEHPEFKKDWFQGYKKVNQKFAEAIKQEIKGKVFVWVHDYQLALVPKYLERQKDMIVAMFWHIPWPTWEVFRILPYKREILESMLACDFLSFHRGYHVRNFLRTVERELGVRIDEETSKVYFNKHVVTVKNLPLGVDTDVVKSLVEPEKKEPLHRVVKNFIISGIQGQKDASSQSLFKKHKVILGVDRLDYTKGLRNRLLALDRFLEKNKHYVGKIVYLGILAPSRESIPSYQALKNTVKELADQINLKYTKNNWQPIHMIYEVLSRKDIINFLKKANLCLVTPLDDGMNLVSKEFVIASSFSENPGMLVLSQFAGSAIDLTSALIVNPYDIDQVADSIKEGLEMAKKERKRRIDDMMETLEEKNVYQWAYEFVRSAQVAARKK